MRILIVSKFFYARGGAEVVGIGTRQLLLEAGHEVRVFAMDYPENLKLPENADYASQVSFEGGLGNKLKAFKRLMGLGDVKSKFRKVLNDFKPDVVHLHNIHSYLSPVVGEMAHKAGARVVWTLHDLKLLCPAYLGRRPDGSVCQDCIGGKFHIMEHNCLKGSRLASFMALLEAKRWSRRKLDAFTDAFIAPSHFMADMMKKGGFTPSKIHVLHNFIDPPKLDIILRTPQRPANTEPYFAYVGRLSAEKGVKTLVRAALKAGVKLKLAGDGPLRSELEAMAAGSKQIEFLGFQGPEQIALLQRNALACVLVSECYENNPLSVIESLCAGTPVIGAEIGGIPELIEPFVNGVHVPPGDADALAYTLADFQGARYNRAEISKKACNQFSQQTHFSLLLKIYTGT